MNIGIDGYEANIDNRVGIGQYAYQLLIHLQKLDKKNNYTIFLPQAPLQDMPQNQSNWRYVVGKPGPYWTIMQLPQLIKNEKLDLFLSPTHYSPWFIRLPKILAVMDLSYLHYPNMFHTIDLLQLKYMGALSIKRAKKIFTISEFSKIEIVEHYKYPEIDVEVTYPGLNINYEKFLRSSSSPLKAIINNTNYNSKIVPFILFVGTIQPRKNIVRLIEAFEMLDESDLQLVIVGKCGWLFETIMQKIKNSPKKQRIIYKGFVDDTELAGLYSHARCFCLPSLYEGFGLPVVEALAFGCPVVISNTSSLPEVAGEAGIYVDPLNCADIAKGLKKAVQLNVSNRYTLIKNGWEHIKKFTWEKCAKNTIEVFNSFKQSD